MRTTPNDVLAREGYPILLGALVLTVLAYWWHPLIAVIPGLFLVFSVYFFRNPKRTAPVGESFVITPADGKVLSVSTVDEGRFLKDKRLRVCIFMSPFNVHVNRIPVTGTVETVSYNRGKFFPAYAEKASLDNEQNAVVIANAAGEKILFIQIAGWLARRIVSYAKPGERWEQGSIYGLIRFGSRMDVYLPLNYNVKVKVGEMVKAGETILANKI